MKGRILVIVLDGFGIGAMEDVAKVRPQDLEASTYRHILEKHPELYLPHLYSMGLLEMTQMGSTPCVGEYGKAALKHEGADTFYGHQEIMCSEPKMPKKTPFHRVIDRVEKALLDEGFKVVRHGKDQKFLWVNECMAVADNIECDLGSAINVTATLDGVDFETVKKVGRIVRSVVTVPRVIAFGGRDVKPKAILNAVFQKDDFIGISAPLSGVYDKDYHCIHLGYGIDSTVQVPHILARYNIPTYLVGKVADIVENPYGESHSIVETNEVFKCTLSLLEKVDTGFICVNVQETDLSGHGQDSLRYKRILETADHYIGQIRLKLKKEDVLIVMADHGNDPTIGHSKHTREYVPILRYTPSCQAKQQISTRETLADVGASVLKYFNIEEQVFGKAF